MGLRAIASTMFLAGALVVVPPGCTRSGAGGATGTSGHGGQVGGASGGAGTSAVTGTSGTGGVSGTGGASGIGGASDSTGMGGTSIGGAGGAPGTGGSVGGLGGGGGGAGAGDLSGSDGGGSDSATTDAEPDAPACTQGLPCKPANYCRIGMTSCTTGSARCVDTGQNEPNGTVCGTGAECQNGVCNTHECDVTRMCASANPCHVGMITCVTGAVTCRDTGTALPDGTRCAADKVCLSGSCVACVTSDAGCANP